MTDRPLIVRVEPAGLDILVTPPATLMESAEAQGIRWPTTCGGEAECGTCFVLIADDQAGLLPPVDKKEQRGLGLVSRMVRRRTEATVRLACQLAPTKDLVVERKGIRPTPTDT